MFKQASALIPAYNEEKTIFAVVRAAASHPLIAEVIVIADGCTDNTIAQARAAGATKIIELSENHGKGQALDAGIHQAHEETLVFLDADLYGLQPDMLTHIIEPVLKNEKDMMMLQLDLAFDLYHHLSPLLQITGQRCLKRSFWYAVPAEYRQGFRIEVALNYYAQMLDLRVGCVCGAGLNAVWKEGKRGPVSGTLARWWEFGEWSSTLVKLHIKHKQHPLFVR